MPRKARIDAPGALHHIICRGIERKRIFYDNADRNDFVKRISVILNPLRARVVSDLKELDRYPYSGHSRLMAKIKDQWQDVDIWQTEICCPKKI